MTLMMIEPTLLPTPLRALLLALLLFGTACGEPPSLEDAAVEDAAVEDAAIAAKDAGAGLSPVDALRGATDEGALEGFAVADGPRTFAFPADHGPHPEFRTEWWYWVGTLRSAEGRRFGFQLTFFQQALAPDDPTAPERGSKWASRHVMMAHFAVADLDGGAGRSFRSAERFSRTGAGLSGARLDVTEGLPQLDVWLEDWSVRSEDAGPEGGEANGTDPVFPLRMRARGDGAALDLRLVVAKPPVLQGEGGWSRKGTAPGSASYYYSMTHLPAQGRLELDGRDFEVEGRAWLDREWSTSQLEGDQVGWDWLALWLDDGRELMVYNLRLAGGGLAPTRHGALIEVDGRHHHLSADQYRLEPEGRWTSPRGGAVYPARWRLRLPAEELDLGIEPLLADQELDVSFRYWEGAVAVRDRASGAALGEGYLEMVGHGGDK